ncbi:T7SS effector LXG polymorphic toxin [Staphylococcus argensis]|uniref:Transposase n=1 Tax=Staphylococcus argensis TaxID=1607738 RepID=A0A2K4FCE7_9STAP|nr:T7SS effector LXG polymorphic toxin [Staphylococcus argensis]MCY6991648.1 LXG domain-containing protein [Staphylococcus argensis]POA09038.1 transposase [Staphylococcus argensis]
MSIDMYLGKSRNQSSDVSSTVNDITSDSEDVLKEISKFVGEDELQGQAYDSGKQFFSSVLIPLAASIRTLGELTQQACDQFVDKYQSDVDTQSLKESELQEDIKNLDHQISHLDAMKGPSTHTNAHKEMVGSLKDQKQKLKEKLDKLREFNSDSPNIFKEVESFQKNVEEGIKQAKSSWNPGKQAFDIPSGKKMKWAEAVHQKTVQVDIRNTLQKVQDGKKLNKEDMYTIISYGQEKLSHLIPKKVQKEIDEDIKSIANDLSMSGSTELMEEFGKVLSNTQGLSLDGKNYKNIGEGIRIAGKFGGKAIPIVGFGIGMYTDIHDEHKTIGEALIHNGAITGLQLGIGALITGALVVFPPGWAVLAGIALTTLASYGISKAYDKNLFGIKSKTEWIGRNKIDPSINWTKNEIKNNYSLLKRNFNYDKSLIQGSYNQGMQKSKKVLSKNVIPKVISTSINGISSFKEINNDTNQAMIKGGEKIYEFSNSVRKKVGESINNMQSSINPMQSW